MKKSKFTETGAKVKEIVRKLGITEQRFYRRKRKTGGLGPSELQKLRLLEEETRRLEKLVADLSLELSARSAYPRTCFVLLISRWWLVIQIS